MISSNINKLRFRELEIKTCLALAKDREQSEANTLYQRVISHAEEGIRLAAQLDLLLSLKQLLYVSANVHHLLKNIVKRSECSTKAMRLVAAERFLSEQTPSLLSVDDFTLNTANNRQLSGLLQQLVAQE